jgi:hypothetical protein
MEEPDAAPERRTGPGLRRDEPPRPDGGLRPDEYEYRVFTLPRWTTRAQARQLLTDHAEYGRWELSRVQLSMTGARRVWLRRRVMRVARTL